ncbi:hypothetical protein E4T66_12145 [Sinimarinibacterium sp. CAU 1509]|uniref:hypothetical protein n=1 Tax=Sinimarinibacterium sp. CAU 1509 TaxID=2562283 RepID=UPI0010ACAE00|nr:hypothetical protein [Sinimarinibacterium sp. CAU 1509]TJY59926.1 hypothetical protein E4T66_12145 [Sinimarinibacterium sp. CAU 1509]
MGVWPTTRVLLLTGAALVVSACGDSAPVESGAGPVVSGPTPTPAPTPLPTHVVPKGEWIIGDAHVHDDHSADGSFFRQAIDQGAIGNVSVADQIAQGERMGLQWMPLTDHRTYDQHYDPLWTSDQLLLIPGEEANGSPHSTVHGAIDTIVQGANPEGAPEFQRLQWSVWDAHSQDASWTIAHPEEGSYDEDHHPTVLASVVGIDNVETWNRGSDPEGEIDYAENRWNAGFRFGIVGGGDNHFRELWLVAGPGMPYTGVLAEDLSERALLDGMRSGRTRINTSELRALSPTVTLQADFQNDGEYEAINGDEVFVPAGTPGRLRIRIEHGTGTQLLLYKSPGRIAGAYKTYVPLGPDMVYQEDIVAEAEPTWYRLEARGPGGIAAINTNDLPVSLLTLLEQVPNQLRAVSAPIFISTGPADPQAEVPIPADQGGDDGAEIALGEIGHYSGFPAVAVADGVTHLVAEAHRPACTQVVYRRMGEGGEPVDLAPASCSARFPKIAARNNDVWVAWQDERASQIPRRPAIYLRHSSDGGRSWGGEIALRVIEGRAERPDIAITASGRPVVVWQEIGAGKAFDVFAQVVGEDAEPANLSAEGKTVQAPMLFDTRSALYPASVWPRVAVSADGRIAVAFQDNRDDIDPLWTGSTAGRGTDPDDWQIRVMRRGDDGAWLAAGVVGDAARADRHPALAWSGDGKMVLAWDSKEMESSGRNLSIQSAVSGDDGVSWSIPEPVALAPEAMSQYPSLAAQSDGSVVSAWYDTRSADWRWRIVTARYAVDIGWSTGDLIESRGINTWPALADGMIAFATTRNAVRLQRDRTQQIAVMRLGD